MIERIGYYTYEIPTSGSRKLMEICIRYGVVISHMREGENKLSFRLPMYHARHFERVMKHEGVTFCRGALEGIAGSFKRMIIRPGLISGILLSIFLYIWLNSMVWEVRVVSYADVDEDRVLNLLAECGLHEGSRISQLDEDVLVADYLMKDGTAAFVSIHMRGVVAEVEIIPRDYEEEPEKLGEPCNIVATRNALITDITVYSGRAMVKVGETVKVGDILVSGVMTDATGTHLVCASADVRGECTDTIGVLSPDIVTKNRIAERRFSGMTLTFFGKAIRVGHTETGADQLVEKKQIYLFDRIRLPLSIAIYRTYKTEEIKYTRTVEEQLARAEAMLEEKLDEKVGDGALLFYEKHGEETNEGYSLTAKIVFENNIGKSLAFNAEKQ